ncbi:hypothetical protein KDRO_E08620 [Kluyveromyces lactis]|nr:hypothetical protein KDRO_E06180 [Kluyveromyces lactis]QEU61979.1 hypothetical protein KDRO_E08620 [Kluyveromyces lactis]
MDQVTKLLDRLRDPLLRNELDQTNVTNVLRQDIELRSAHAIKRGQTSGMPRLTKRQTKLEMNNREKATDLHNNETVTIVNEPVEWALLESSKVPKLGNVRERIMTTENGFAVTVLLDTGAPVNIIGQRLVDRLGLDKLSAPKLQVRGAVGGPKVGSAECVVLKLQVADKTYEVSAYVYNEVTNRVILGNPYLEEHEELLQFEQKAEIAAIDFIEQDSIYNHYGSGGKEFIIIYPIEVDKMNETSRSFEHTPHWIQEEFKDTVSDELQPRIDSGVEGEVTHEIWLKKDGRGPRVHPYRMTPKTEKVARELVADLLKKNFIVESKSPFTSPIVLVKKKDGTYRMCVDFRTLNKDTIKDPYPLPYISDLFIKVGNAKLFSTIDLHSGYHQIPMKKEHRQLTAFTTPFGKYEYMVMPFGLVNAPSTFCRMMDSLFRNLEYVMVYLDDILIYSTSEEDHWKHVASVLRILKEHHLVAKASKCYFGQRQVEFVGHTVSADGIRPTKRNIDAIEELQVTADVKCVQRFLGMVNFYRRFIKDCHKKCAPLLDFVHGKASWSDAQREAITVLKKLLTSKPILVSFLPGEKYRLTTDASIKGLGGVLERLDQQGKLTGVVGYFSKTLQKAQKNYPPGELEMLAIMEALAHFRVFLHGHHVTIRTDHIGLLSIRNKSEPSNRIARWLDKLAEYSFDLEYLEGSKNVVADPLSRDLPEQEDEQCLTMVINAMEISTWQEDYPKDPLCVAVLEGLDKEVTADLAAEDQALYHKYKKRWINSHMFRDKFHTDDDKVLYYNEELVVPKTRRREIMNTHHDHLLFGGHYGIEITVQKIRSNYFWPGLHKSVTKYVQSCMQCQLMKNHRNRSQGLLTPLEIPDGRWKDISIDFVTGITLPTTNIGIDMIMVVVDRFTKRAQFIGCKKQLTSVETIDLLIKHVFCRHGFPRTITSDRDPRFTDKYYKEVTKRLGVKLTMSTANHPQTDGQTERVIQNLVRLIRTYCEEYFDDWQLVLPMIEFCYNATYNTVIKMTPFEADLGYTPEKPRFDMSRMIDARSESAVEHVKRLQGIAIRIKDELTEAAIVSQTSKNPHRRQLLLNVGEYVLIHKDAYFRRTEGWKLTATFFGPFRIVRKIADNAYELDLPSMLKKHRVINVEWLKKFESSNRGYVKEAPRTERDMELRIYEICAVVGVSATHVFCNFREVDPRIMVEVPMKVFLRLPETRRSLLLERHNELWSTQEKGEKDVVR